MNEGINLLAPNKHKTVLIPMRNLMVLRMVATVLLFVVSAISIVLFILVAFSPLPELRKQEESARLTLSSYHPDMAKLALLDDRTTTIQEVLATRKSYEELLGLVQEKLPTDVEISALQTDKKSLVLTIDSQSLQSLDSFLSSLMQLVQEKKNFSQISMVSLIDDETKNVFSLTINLTML